MLLNDKHLKIGIASDHAGYQLKADLIDFVKAKFSIDLSDLGPHSEASIDYPLQGKKMGEAITSSTLNAGILICGSGVGISIAANRFPAVRAALCANAEIATLARQHNDANILVLGARFLKASEAEACVEAFLITAFEGGRHARRVKQLSQ